MLTAPWEHRHRAAACRTVLKCCRTLELTRSSRQRHEPGTIIASTLQVQKLRHTGGERLV